MSESQQPANDAEPEPIDPEIEALLDFEPVPRKLNRPDGWTPDLQRRFVRLIVETGTPQRAAVAIKKRLSGIEAVYRDDEKGEFREAWDRAVELGRARQTAEANAETDERLRCGVAVPAHRRLPDETAAHGRGNDGQIPPAGSGQRRNELGEWEDEGSLAARAEDARDSISGKLRNSRRLYLREISDSAGKRAAFEILTGLPIDWDKAARLEPQADEPWRRPNLRQPDMLLAAESGWLGGVAHGPDKMAELRAAIDAHLAEQGLEPVDWSADQ